MNTNSFKILLAIFLLLIFNSCANSQTTNFLSYNQYSNIEINNISLNRINLSQGEENKIKALFPDQKFEYYETTIPDNYREISSPSLKISFNENFNQSKYEVGSIKILSKDIRINIMNQNISIGSSINQLGSPNINDDSIVYKINSDSPEFLLSFESFLLIKFNKSSNLITEIELVVLE